MNLREWLPPRVPPTLPYVLAVNLLERVTQKPRFGKPDVRFPQLMSVVVHLLEQGALVGHARGKYLNVLVRIFCEPGTEQMFADFLIGQAEEAIRQYETAVGTEPDNFFDFLMVKESLVDGSPPDPLLRWKNRKVDIELAYSLCETRLVLGIALGARYPDLVEKMWNNTWGNDHDELWARVADSGLPIERPKLHLPFPQRQEVQLVTVALWVKSAKPELLDPLKLNTILQNASTILERAGVIVQ